MIKPESVRRARGQRYPDLLVCLSLFVLAGLVCLPALAYVFPNGDDLAQHYWWTTEFANELRNGMLYPRWLSGAYAGQGSPVMLYYPPLPFYFSAAFHLVLGDALSALAWSCCLALALSGIAAYIFSRSFLPRTSSLIAAAFYVTAHYHLFDLYQRSAFNEFWAFAWIPLVFHAGYLVSSRKDWAPVSYLAASYSLLFLTHLPSTLITTLVFPVYMLLLTREVRKLLRGVIGLIVGGGMAAIYLAPVIFETGYLRSVRDLARPRYSDSFLFENLGRAFDSVPFPSSSNFLSFVFASDWHAVAFLLLLLVISVVVWRERPEGSLLFWKGGLPFAMWVVTLLSLLMTTRISAPLWLVIPRLSVLQFPVRWFVLTSLGASLLVGVTMALLSSSKRSSVGAAAVGVVIALSLALSVLVVSRARFQEEALQKRLAIYTDVLEYHPSWWDERPHPEFDTTPVVVEQGDASIRAADETGIAQSFDVTSNLDSVLRFRTLYFPGWVARIDGTTARLGPSKEGHIQLTVPHGEHSVTLDLEDTTPRRAGKIISGASLLVFVAMVVGSVIARRSKPADFDTPVEVADERKRIETQSVADGRKKVQTQSGKVIRQRRR